MRVTLEPGPVQGCVAAPPSKSMAHRALVCAALADGESVLAHLGTSQDITATRNAMALLGARLREAPDGLHVTGAGEALRAAAENVQGAGPADRTKAGQEMADAAVENVRAAAAAGEAGAATKWQGETGAMPEMADAAENVRAAGAAGGVTPAPAAPDGASSPCPAGASPALLVDCGESGSTLRFLIPLFSLTGRRVTFTGRGRLLQRPQDVYARLFAEKNCVFVQTPDAIVVEGALPAGEYDAAGDVSSQFISGLLFALALLPRASRIRIAPPVESRSYIDLTLQAMRDFGVRGVGWESENVLAVAPRGGFCARACTVEGDYSQAAFFAVLGAVCGGVTVTGLRADSLQGDAVIFDILSRCGAHFSRETRPDGLAFRFEKAPLHAVRIDLADCPDLGPILMVLGLFCAGETVIGHAGRLRLKESDRIAAMEQEIRRLGGRIDSTPDTVTVRGGVLHGSGALQGHNDHRVVMALAVAALCAGVPASIAGAEAVRKSYPGFFADLAALGAHLVTEDENA